MNQRKKALDILKEGDEKALEGKQKQEIEYLIEKISREEENLFTGANNVEEDLEDNNISQMEKEKENDSENISISEEKNKSVNKEQNGETEKEVKAQVKEDIKFDDKIEEEKSSIIE